MGTKIFRNYIISLRVLYIFQCTSLFIVAGNTHASINISLNKLNAYSMKVVKTQVIYI